MPQVCTKALNLLKTEEYTRAIPEVEPLDNVDCRRASCTMRTGDPAANLSIHSQMPVRNAPKRSLASKVRTAIANGGYKPPPPRPGGWENCKVHSN